MGKPFYRVSRDEAWIKNAIRNAEHLLVKTGDGTIFCQIHKKDATMCATKRESDLVLENKLDGGRYVLTVVRVRPYLGRLTLTRERDIVLQTDVGLAYDAPFGPDAEDVQSWYELAIDAADSDYFRRGESPPRP